MDAYEERYSEFQKKNHQDWLNIQKGLFGNNIPKRHVWDSLEDIVAVLNTIGSIPNSNHMFYPRSGGLDITGAKESVELGCIELITDGLFTIVKPKRLMFESFGPDSDWNYFRLETSELAPSGVYEPNEFTDEEVTEIEPGHYANSYVRESGEYEGRPLPKGTRTVTRNFKGDFVIFKKTSAYNQDTSTYDARHNKMTSDLFREYIERSIARTGIN
ncbi:hypothetical protein KB206_04405 [Microvirga sp. STS02]|uniref:hypothetical protein n=1 Tax=Hymenobacter negativus TaxID=2795026 RepID=UPI0018DC13BC|nr:MULTISPECIES: hypothetical protein [Bacteria]MBH8568111.1 hypothetical protein [Hymenobacter negativus]MBR7207846.1 hypothetical protein [Microvirga sp. STS02]